MNKKVRGETLKASLDFIEEKYGEEGIEKFYREISKQTKSILSQLIGIAFYSYNILFEITKKICDVFGNGEPSFAREIGKYSAKYSFKTFFKMLKDIKDINWLINKGSFFYSYYYYNFGKLVVIKNISGEAIARIKEVKNLDVYFEERIAGWMEGALMLFNKSSEIKITKRISKGDEYTEFAVSW